MSNIQTSHYELLKRKLESDFVPRLPPIIDSTKTAAQIALKNQSRAFSAFVLYHLCGVSVQVAANAVVDDFDDNGVDAIFYDSATLYLVQSKFKQSEQFKQDEALAFCQGVRKLIQQDLTGFNQHVRKRQLEIENAIEHCSHIQLVIAYVGDGISDHAKTIIHELLTDAAHGEPRFKPEFINYDAQQAVSDLQNTEAPASIDTAIYIDKHEFIESPRNTHTGLIQLLDLVALYDTHGSRLYEKNIRTFIGKKTDVNSAIRQTLTDASADFFYFNNGITALSSKIMPKGIRSIDQCRRLEVAGFSVVNGAQTITSAAQFLKDNPGTDIAAARVAITIIEVQGFLIKTRGANFRLMVATNRCSVAIDRLNGTLTKLSEVYFTGCRVTITLSDSLASVTFETSSRPKIFMRKPCIEVSPDEDFGKAITQARNHQNQVSNADFAALDDEQERLRRELAVLGIHYVYKRGMDAAPGVNAIRFDEAAHALALFQTDPRYVVWLKREPERLTNVQSEEYKSLFSATLTAQQLVNAVYFLRYIRQRIAEEAGAASGQERLTYQHGQYVLGWLLAQRVRQQQRGHLLLDPNKIKTVLSGPFDELRQQLWFLTQPLQSLKGPLALFKNQTDVLPVLQSMSINAYGLQNQAAISAKIQQQNPDQPYPVDLFTYITDKAPQLSNLL